MFRFSAILLSSMLGGAMASNPLLASYEPVTLVTDHAGIAGDQSLIEKYCGQGDTAGVTAAQKIYEMGGNSKSYALLTLSEALSAALVKGTDLTGETADGTVISGALLEDYAAGATQIGFQYSTSDDVMDYVGCKVGGLPTADQITTGCLVANGTVTSSGAIYEYTTVENLNARTIRGFSTNANKRMKPGENESAPYYDYYLPYLEYFGENNYAFGDAIVSAGFEGGVTSLSNGNVDLSGYNFEGRCQIAKKGTAYIITALYAVREMYDAITDCKQGCATSECNDDAVHALDEAVAFYVGNYHSEDGVGNLAYALAEKRCKNFATCVDKVEGESVVNQEIFGLFNKLKTQFANGECDATTEGIERIVQLMQVPLIQGTLRYAYLTSVNDSPTESMQSEGAIFATGVLPKVHECDPAAATTIYDNMKLNAMATKADYAAVKSAFESVYDCMGITCADVGGIVDEVTGNTYAEGAQPCGGVNNLAGVKGVESSNGSSGNKFTLGLNGVIASILAALIM